MSQSTADDDGNVVTASQIDYKQSMYSHPSYKFCPQFSNTFGQPIVLGSSQVPVTINIPPEVFNLSQSYLMYSVNLPSAGALNYIWYAQQALKEISHIQFYSSSNQWIVDLDNVQNYLDIVLKKELARDEFLSEDPMVGISGSNSLVNVIPALRNTNQQAAANNNLASNPSSVNYDEPSYYQVGALNGQVSYQVRFPLRLLKNTAFSIDKNLYFGGQTTYLKVYFGPLSKICYASTSNANPSAGTKTSKAPANSATIGPPYSGGQYTAPVQPINFQLMLAVETNQDLRTMTINKVSSSGLSYLIPYVQAFKNSNTGTGQTISIQLDQGNGRSLMKVYHALYNSQEDLDTAYDHANTPTIAGVTDAANAPVNQKLTQYYTMLNGQRIQDLTLDCTYTGGFTDYMQHKRMLRGSIISNLNIYQYNWHHCDDWTDFGPRYDQDNKGELVSGLPLGTSNLTWSFVGVSLRPSTTNTNTFQHYTWFVFVKKLTMAPSQIIVQ